MAQIDDALAAFKGNGVLVTSTQALDVSQAYQAGIRGGFRRLSNGGTEIKLLPTATDGEIATARAFAANPSSFPAFTPTSDDKADREELPKKVQIAILLRLHSNYASFPANVRNWVQNAIDTAGTAIAGRL